MWVHCLDVHTRDFDFEFFFFLLPVVVCVNMVLDSTPGTPVTVRPTMRHKKYCIGLTVKTDSIKNSSTL